MAGLAGLPVMGQVLVCDAGAGSAAMVERPKETRSSARLIFMVITCWLNGYFTYLFIQSILSLVCNIALALNFSFLVQLTYHTDYALRILIYLMSAPGRKVTTREMADFYGVSLNHLTKVAKALTRAGWLTTSRGAGGGLLLAPHTADTKVGEIVRYAESGALVECFVPAINTCPITASCRLKPVLYKARRAFYDVLDAHTVRELAMTSPV